jgi:hypothetical protein
MRLSWSLFNQVWTLAERMARSGRNEGLHAWLSLPSWLGMVVDALLGGAVDAAAAALYK